VVICQVQAMHIVSLYGEYLYPRIVDAAVAPDEPSDLLGLGRPMAHWASEQVLRVGLITLYHQWERMASAFLSEQGETWSIKFRQRATSSVNNRIKAVLRESFDADILAEVWQGLEELRRLVNTLKHADMKTFNAFAADYPSYFVSGLSPTSSITDFENSLSVKREHFNSLASSVTDFWARLPYVVKYSAA
jgi:hypothetical protein